MKKLMFLVVIPFVYITSAHGFEVDESDPIQLILMECRHPDGPTQADDLLAYAKAKGLSNAEMSARLMELAELGLVNDADALQRQLSYGALGGLSYFGGEDENAFVRDVMKTTQDVVMRHIAVRVGIRMMPEKWEEWVQEVATDELLDDLTRFDAYEEAYRIGKNADKNVRQRVESVLSGLSEQDESGGNQEHLRRWSAELKQN